jgi:hypothetical protein
MFKRVFLTFLLLSIYCSFKFVLHASQESFAVVAAKAFSEPSSAEAANEMKAASLNESANGACQIICPANLTVPTFVNLCGANVDYAPPTVIGTCGTVTCTPTQGSFFPKGATTVNCVAQLGSTCFFTITVNDVQPPTLVCPPDLMRSTDLNQCAAVVIYAPPAVADNCPGVGSVNCTPPSGSPFPKGSTDVHCSAMDASGNNASCSFAVTINDTQAPTIICPPNQFAASLGGNVNVNYPLPTVSDNCPGVGIPVCNIPSGSSFPLGTTAVTCMVNDASSNTSSCSFNVTVAVCALTCPANIAKNNDPNQCGAIVSYLPPKTSGTCPTITCSPPSGAFFQVGTTNVFCNAGAEASCAFQVLVADVEVPRLNCPANITFAVAQGQVSTVINYALPVPVDNCTSVTVNCLPPSGTNFPLGTTTVTCTARDASGNTATCAFSANVLDREAPAIECPQDVNLVASVNQTSLVVTYVAPQATDSQSTASVACSPPSGATFGLGVTPVVCTATDASGNRSSCSFKITVSGGPVIFTITPTNVEFGKITPLAVNRKPLKSKNLTPSTFTLENVSQRSVTLTFDSITRTDSDVEARRIINPDDSALYTLSQIGDSGVLTLMPIGSTVTLEIGQKKNFAVKFNPVIPAVAAGKTALSASQVVPDRIFSRINFSLSGGGVNVGIDSRVETRVKLIHPVNPKLLPEIILSRSGDEFIATFSAFDSNLDVNRAKYEFLDASGGVAVPAIEVDLTQALRETNLIRGQSFTLAQTFVGALSHPEIVGVKITVFDGESNVAAPLSLSAALQTESLLQIELLGLHPVVHLRQAIRIGQ